MTGITPEQAEEMLNAIVAGKATRIDPCAHFQHAHPQREASVWDFRDLSYRRGIDVATTDIHAIVFIVNGVPRRRYYAGKCACGMVFYYD